MSDWEGGYDLVDTGSFFAQVKKRRPAEKSVKSRSKRRCGTTKDDGTKCRRVAPCREHHPK